MQVVEGPLVHPFLNDVETFASSANDFVSYYSRALQGEFFRHNETLNEFRRILSLCDFIYLVPLPLGVTAHAKSGNADIPGFTRGRLPAACSSMTGGFISRSSSTGMRRRPMIPIRSIDSLTPSTARSRL